MTQELSLNLGYFRTIPGLVKPVTLTVGLFAMITAGSSICSVNGFVWFTLVCAFLTTGAVTLAYLVSFVDLMARFPWLLAEMAHSAMWSFFHFVVLWVAVSQSNNVAVIICTKTPFIFLAIFALVNFAAYGFNSWLFFKAWKQELNPSFDIEPGQHSSAYEQGGHGQAYADPAQGYQADQPAPVHDTHPKVPF